MEMMRLRYIGRKSVSKLYFNRKRYVFNKENGFTENVPRMAWNLVKQTNEFIPAPVLEKSPEVPKPPEEVPVEKKVDNTVCDICGFKAKSYTGLLAHKRMKHEQEEEE